jgi:hypothetical protein
MEKKKKKRIYTLELLLKVLELYNYSKGRVCAKAYCKLGYSGAFGGIWGTYRVYMVA